ncbi:MAG: phosphomannomutase/phosphoglucomutase, partial [Firmicutes bacterium]|nr:phosphomannomutase/phosphoglucomutase [Bacillota bacterium]
MTKDYKKLKSGSDIRGTAIGNATDLTDQAVADISYAFALWVAKQNPDKQLKIAVGHDSRLSADRIKKLVIDMLVQCNTQVYDCGLCSTPSMFMMTKYAETDCDASIMITASHHPYDKNGLKFFTKNGGLESKDIAEILEIAQKYLPTEAASKSGGQVIKGDFVGLYCKGLVDKVVTATGRKKPLEGLKIVLDAGNGAGGFFAERVLDLLGADTSGSQFLEPDGNFPNHVPNPEDKDAMRSLSKRVVETKADLGIIFDTDVDRAAIADSKGNEINRNRLIALISAILLDNSQCSVLSAQCGVIVTDSVTSDGLREFIEAKGGRHHRYKRGYKNVINEAIRLNQIGQDAPLAIETSGHAAFRENYFLDDGA